jgi:signal transduction histidine kinase
MPTVGWICSGVRSTRPQAPRSMSFTSPWQTRASPPGLACRGSRSCSRGPPRKTGNWLCGIAAAVRWDRSSQAHRRDLAVSLGGFVLLAVSISMWIVVSDRAQRLARLQLDFVTAVSHELRTPLTIIRSAADNIARGFIREDQQLVQYGTVIGNQARRLSDMVEQVLLFGSTRELNQPYVLGPLDVSEVIDATLTVCADLIQESQVSVEQDIQSSLPPAMGDPLALSQCLQNLITNGLKYGGEPRWIGIRASLVKDGSRSEIQVSVCDRGMGIAASDLRHIFKPFYRSPLVAAAQIPGTGLGLSVARSLAEAMKGQLTVTSRPGRGSIFTVHLPCADQDVPGCRRSPIAS